MTCLINFKKCRRACYAFEAGTTDVERASTVYQVLKNVSLVVPSGISRPSGICIGRTNGSTEDKSCYKLAEANYN